MKYVSKRQINKEAKAVRYQQIYKDVVAGKDWDSMAKKYGYKNAQSMKTTYYMYIVPFMKSHGN